MRARPFQDDDTALLPCTRSLQAAPAAAGTQGTSLAAKQQSLVAEGVKGATSKVPRKVSFAQGPLKHTADGHPQTEGRKAKPVRDRGHKWGKGITKKSILEVEQVLVQDGGADIYQPSIIKLKRRCGLLPKDKKERKAASSRALMGNNASIEDPMAAQNAIDSPGRTRRGKAAAAAAPAAQGKRGGARAVVGTTQPQTDAAAKQQPRGKRKQPAAADGEPVEQSAEAQGGKGAAGRAGAKRQRGRAAAAGDDNYASPDTTADAATHTQAVGPAAKRRRTTQQAAKADEGTQDGTAENAPAQEPQAGGRVKRARGAAAAVAPNAEIDTHVGSRQHGKQAKKPRGRVAALVQEGSEGGVATGSTSSLQAVRLALGRVSHGLRPLKRLAGATAAADSAGAKQKKQQQQAARAEADQGPTSTHEHIPDPTVAAGTGPQGNVKQGKKAGGQGVGKGKGAAKGKGKGTGGGKGAKGKQAEDHDTAFVSPEAGVRPPKRRNARAAAALDLVPDRQEQGGETPDRRAAAAAADTAEDNGAAADAPAAAAAQRGGRRGARRGAAAAADAALAGGNEEGAAEEGPGAEQADNGVGTRNARGRRGRKATRGAGDAGAEAAQGEGEGQVDAAPRGRRRGRGAQPQAEAAPLAVEAHGEVLPPADLASPAAVPAASLIAAPAAVAAASHEAPLPAADAAPQLDPAPLRRGARRASRRTRRDASGTLANAAAAVATPVAAAAGEPQGSVQHASAAHLQSGGAERVSVGAQPAAGPAAEGSDESSSEVSGASLTAPPSPASVCFKAAGKAGRAAAAAAAAVDQQPLVPQDTPLLAAATMTVTPATVVHPAVALAMPRGRAAARAPPPAFHQAPATAAHPDELGAQTVSLLRGSGGASHHGEAVYNGNGATQDLQGAAGRTAIMNGTTAHQTLRGGLIRHTPSRFQPTTTTAAAPHAAGTVGAGGDSSAQRDGPAASDGGTSVRHSIAVARWDVLPPRQSGYRRV